MFKLCTNKNHSYKHNEQINKQNIDNSECLGVKSDTEIGDEFHFILECKSVANKRELYLITHFKSRMSTLTFCDDKLDTEKLLLDAEKSL
jgi:hypothetical protein